MEEIMKRKVEIKLEPDIALKDMAQYRWEVKDIVFSIEDMKKEIEKIADEKGLKETLNALPFAVEKHEGQFRKGKDLVPYIIHPLTIARQAIALGLFEDSLIAAILLHDVCEDCTDENGEKIKLEALPVGNETRETVRLVTKPEPTYKGWVEDYYKGISSNRLATMVKILDRCNNISTMAAGFSKEKMADYIVATEKYLLPLFDIVEEKYYDIYSEAIFLIKYQMLSTIETVKRLL